MRDDDFEVLVVSVVVAITMFFLGVVFATNLDDDGSLPKCQEDEYLYPVDEAGRAAYEGPGGASPGDLGCFPFDGEPWQPVLGSEQG